MAGPLSRPPMNTASSNKIDNHADLRQLPLLIV
jgi:hypothetical protein